MEQFLASSLRDATPIALAALGGVFAYRAGIFHLGLEGLMLIGAFVGVAVAVKTESMWFAVLAAILVNMLASAVFWLVIVVLRANTIIAGLGLSGIGLGATSYALEFIFKTQGAIQSPVGLPRPVTGIAHGAGEIVSDLPITVWLAPLTVFLCWLALRRSRFGLRLAAVGEYPFAARSAGVDPATMRLVALLLTGVLCALSGVDLALGGLHSFSENMAGGRGYIAFTAVLFGVGNPIGAALASLFFGIADALGIQSQLLSSGGPPREFVLMLPYVLTILAVWLGGILRRTSLEAAAGFSELRE